MGSDHLHWFLENVMPHFCEKLYPHKANDEELKEYNLNKMLGDGGFQKK